MDSIISVGSLSPSGWCHRAAAIRRSRVDDALAAEDDGADARQRSFSRYSRVSLTSTARPRSVMVPRTRTGAHPAVR